MRMPSVDALQSVCRGGTRRSLAIVHACCAARGSAYSASVLLSELTVPGRYRPFLLPPRVPSERHLGWNRDGTGSA